MRKAELLLFPNKWCIMPHPARYCNRSGPGLIVIFNKRFQQLIRMEKSRFVLTAAAESGCWQKHDNYAGGQSHCKCDTVINFPAFPSKQPHFLSYSILEPWILENILYSLSCSPIFVIFLLDRIIIYIICFQASSLKSKKIHNSSCAVSRNKRLLPAVYFNLHFRLCSLLLPAVYSNLHFLLWSLPLPAVYFNLHICLSNLPLPAVYTAICLVYTSASPAPCSLL